MLANLFKPLDQVLLMLLGWFSAGYLEKQSVEVLTAPSPKYQDPNYILVF